MPDKRSISTKWLPRQGMKKAPVVCRDIRQATGGLWESRERRRVRVAFMAKWVRLHPSEPLLWGNALHSFDFQLFRFLSCYFLFITQKHHTFVWRFCCASFSSTHFGGPGGIRTLDLSDANRTLSQLSYRPIFCRFSSAAEFIIAREKEKSKRFFRKMLFFCRDTAEGAGQTLRETSPAVRQGRRGRPR